MYEKPQMTKVDPKMINPFRLNALHILAMFKKTWQELVEGVREDRRRMKEMRNADRNKR